MFYPIYPTLEFNLKYFILNFLKHENAILNFCIQHMYELNVQ